MLYFSRSSPEYDDPNFEYRISFPPLPSIISIGLDEEDFGPNTPSQYSNRTKGGTCYVDRFQDKPDTMFVYDSNHGGVFDLRSGSYVDEPVVPPGAKRYVLTRFHTPCTGSWLKLKISRQRHF